MRGLCVLTLAFLLQSGLLVNRQLILFSDGATEIKDCVDEIFAFCRCHVVLDWFHLRKHCYEALSMTLKSGKSNKEMRGQIMGNLMNILWVGNVAGAIEYLMELPACSQTSEKRRHDGSKCGILVMEKPQCTQKGARHVLQFLSYQLCGLV